MKPQSSTIDLDSLGFDLSKYTNHAPVKALVGHLGPHNSPDRCIPIGCHV